MFLELMLFSITCSLIFSLRLYLTLGEIKEILSPSFVLGSLFSFCWLALVRMLPRLSRVTRIRPKCKIFMAFPLVKNRVLVLFRLFVWVVRRHLVSEFRVTTEILNRWVV